jgi:hypothetical protein
MRALYTYACRLKDPKDHKDRKDKAVAEQWQLIEQIFQNLGKLLAPVWHFLLAWLLLVVWIIWWLWGVNWRKAWPVLAEGAWLPVVLLMIVGALAWAEMAPSDCTCLVLVTVPNFWWQLGAVGLLMAVTLFCGWLQGVMDWTPEEISLEPPLAVAGAHGHGHH